MKRSSNDSQQPAPAYLVGLGAASGAFLVGALLPIILLFGDGAQAPAGSSPSSSASASRLEFLQERLLRFDRTIEWTQKRIDEFTRQLARLRAQGTVAAEQDPEREEPKAEPAKEPGKDVVKGFRLAPLHAFVPLEDPEVIDALDRAGVQVRNPEEWREAVQFVGRELQREDTTAAVMRDVERHVTYLNRHLELTESQSELLRQIKRREADAVGDIYSRMTATNQEALQAENSQVHIDLANEFRRVLSPTQAKKLGPTLYAIYRSQNHEGSGR